MTPTETTISAGNKFALTFAAAFAFVYFAIIEPHFARDPAPEQRVDRTLRQIENAEKRLDRRLARLDGGVSFREARAIAVTAPGGSVATSNSAVAVRSERDEETAINILEKLIQLGMSYQTLSKTKADKKTYSVPLLPVSIDEDALLKFFPVLVFLGLARLLAFRSTLLTTCVLGPAEALPAWAAPVPFSNTRVSFRAWVTVNLLGLGSSGAIVFLSLRFIFLYAREHHAQLRLAAFDAILLLAWSMVYCILIVLAMLQDPPAEKIPEGATA